MHFLVIFLLFFPNFAVYDGELTPSRQKKKSFLFVLLSTFRNFGFAEVTRNRKRKEKRAFLLRFSRFFVTLQEISNHLCLSEVWELTQFSRLRFGNLLISVFCRDMRIVRPLDAEPPACFNGSLSGAKVHRKNEITKLLKDFSLILL